MALPQAASFSGQYTGESFNRWKGGIMIKKQLLDMEELAVTKQMMEIARNDRAEADGRRRYSYRTYRYGKHMMACAADGILKVSIFCTEHLRFGGCQPIYNIFLDKARGNFIVYDFLKEGWSHAALNNLDWPKHAYGPAYTEEKSGRLILQYLLEDGGLEPYDAILAYQERLRGERLLERDMAKMEPWQEKMLQVPGRPKDWPRWVNKVGITQNFIFYEYKRGKNNEGYCTWCGKTVPIGKAKHNTEGRCRCCGRKIQYKSVGRMPLSFKTEDTAYLVQRCHPDGFVVREFYITRYFTRDSYRKPAVNCLERRRVLYDKDIEGTEYHYGLYKKRIRGWIQGPVKVAASYGYTEYLQYYRGKVYGRTIPSLSKKELQRTGFAEMWKASGYICPVEYLGFWKDSPIVEQLAKAGLTQIVTEIMDGYKKIQLKECRGLGQKLGIDRFRLKRLRQNRGGLNYLEWLRHEKNEDKVIPDSAIKWYERLHILPEDIRFVLCRMSEVQVKNYLARQSRESKEPVKALIPTWRDYLAMAARLHMDIDDPIVYRARYLVKRHEEIVNVVEDKGLVLKAGKIAEDFPYVDQNCRSVKDKYEFEDPEYKIMVPESIEDILNEAKELHHCVDIGNTYFDRINSRETYILFLRKKPEVEKAYYTLETEPDGTIRQARTAYNRQHEDYKAAEPFLRKWQRQLKKKLDKEDYEMAARSRELRDVELKELRRKKVKINGGDYQGRLLADVLAEGLIENQADDGLAA